MQSLESNSEDLKDVSSAAHATTTTVAGAVAATRTADVEPDGESSNRASSNGAQGIESKRRCEIEHEIKKGCHQQASSESFSLSPCSPMLQGIQDKAILPSFYADDTHKLGEQHIRQYSSGTINAIGPMEAKLPGTLLYLSGADEAGGGGSSGENTVGGVGGIASVPESHFCTVQAIAWEMEVRASVTCPRVTFHMMGVLAHSNITIRATLACAHLCLFLRRQIFAHQCSRMVIPSPKMLSTVRAISLGGHSS